MKPLLFLFNLLRRLGMRTRRALADAALTSEERYLCSAGDLAQLEERLRVLERCRRDVLFLSSR